MKKYELINETRELYDRTLYRIKALRDFSDVKAGDLGGFVESEYNLSHGGNCWIYENATIYDNATISDNATIYGNAIIYDNATIYGNVIIYDNATIYRNATICGDARIYRNAAIYGNARICENVKISGNARIYGNAVIYGSARIYGNVKISGNARIYDNMKINMPYEELDYYSFDYGRSITALTKDDVTKFNIGCQELLTKEQFIERIHNEDGGLEKNPHRAKYLKVLSLY